MDGATESTGPNLPATMDETIRELMIQEFTLQKELNETQRVIREKREERSKLVDGPKSEVAKELDAIDKEINQLMAKKNKKYDELNSVRNSGMQNADGSSAPAIRDTTAEDNQRTIQETLSLLRLQLPPLRDEKFRLENELKKSDARVVELRKDVDSAKRVCGAFKKGQAITIEQYEKQLQDYEKKIVEVKVQNKQHLIDFHVKEKSNFARFEGQVKEYWKLLEQAFDAQAEAAKMKKDLEKTTADFEKLTTKMKDLESKIAPRQQSPPPGQQADPRERQRQMVERRQETEKKARVILDQIRNLSDQIKQKQDERKEVREKLNPTSEGEKATDEFREAMQKRDEIGSQLGKIRSQIPSKTIDYDKASHSDLIGPKGATINGLQNDFGVVLNVNQALGKLTVRGPEAEIDNCISAIETLLRNAADSRTQLTIPFDPFIRRDLIGPGGSNISRIEEASGARIRILQDTPEVLIQGPKEAVEKARLLVEDFKDSTSHVTIPYKESDELTQYMVGRGGKNVQEIQQRWGLKNISIREGKIEILGPKKSVELAEEYYNEVVKDFQSGLEVKLQPEMIGIIVGKGGETIRKIEEETGARVTVVGGGRNAPSNTKCKVVISGPGKAARAARVQVEDLIKANTRHTVTVPYPQDLRFYLIQPDRRPELPPEEQICILERIRREAGCLRAEAVRNQNHVELIGRKDEVEKGVQLLKEVLAKAKGDAREIKFDGALFTALAMRPEDKNESLLDEIRTESGCRILRADRQSSTISFLGEKEAMDKAQELIQTAINRLSENLSNIPLPSKSVIPLIVGSGGSTIQGIRRETNCELFLDDAVPEIRLYGTAENREAAEKKIKEILEKEGAGSGYMGDQVEGRPPPRNEGIPIKFITKKQPKGGKVTVSKPAAKPAPAEGEAAPKPKPKEKKPQKGAPEPRGPAPPAPKK